MAQTQIEEIVQKLRLNPHPEGGFFRETYRSQGVIKKTHLPQDYSGDRNFSTSIYFLLTSDNFSAFHKIHQDEQWHFYKGSPIQLHMIDGSGKYSHQIIGSALNSGEQPQYTVPGGCWFAAEVAEDDSYALIGCTVSPGFHFDDFILASRDELIQQYPEHRAIISRLTRL